MKPLVFDASALLALLFDESGAAAVESLIHRATEKEQPMLMTAVNWAETCYTVEKKRGLDALGQAGEFISNTQIEIIAADRQLAEIAARYRAADTLALADAFAAALARTRKADLVTADLEFKAVESAIKVVWLKNPH